MGARMGSSCSTTGIEAMTRYCVQVSRFYEVTADDTDDAVEKALEKDYFKGARAQVSVTDLDEVERASADSSAQPEGKQA
jgi:hypothetical protein